jgi:BASS family bile acid:Na+ symporter
MLLRAAAPTLSERFADRVLAMAGMGLTLAGLALLVLHRQLFIAVRGQEMMALVVLLLLAMAIGHLLGGPHPDDRTALAIACATRHIGVAVIVATSFRGPRTMVLLAAYVVASAVVSIPYLQWRRRQARVEEPMVG